MQQRLNRPPPSWGLLVILGLMLIPLLLWWRQEPLTVLWATRAGRIRLFAKASAFEGTVLFAVALILSARFKVMESICGGLDRVYELHKLTASFGLGLLVLHPYFLMFRNGFWRIWISLSNWPILLGRLALLGFLVIILFPLFRPLRHQSFVFWHRFLGVMFLIGAVHAFVEPGAMDQNLPLTVYILLLSGGGVAAYAYFTLFGQVLKKRYIYVVQRVKKLSGSVTELTLYPWSVPMVFTPGQFSFVSVVDQHVDAEPHPYSFASGQADRSITFLVKSLGDYTGHLGEVRIGSTVRLEGPYGQFSYLNVRNRNQIWVAGGIGITPFLSMVRSYAANSPYYVYFFYAVKTPEETLYAEELERLSANYLNFKFILYAEAEEGFLTVEKMSEITGEPKEYDWLLCGPLVMVDNLSKQLGRRGVTPKHIHFEKFDF